MHQHPPASEHHAGNGYQNGAVSWDTSSTGQASGDWSRRTAWGSGSSLSTQYPHTMPISQASLACGFIYLMNIVTSVWRCQRCS